MALRNRRPQEHRAAWTLNRPARPVQSTHKNVAPALVRRADLLRIGLALAERDNRRDLYGLKYAVIQIALDPRQRRDHSPVAQEKPDAPPRHVVTLRKREDLDRHLFRALNL